MLAGGKVAEFKAWLLLSQVHLFAFSAVAAKTCARPRYDATPTPTAETAQEYWTLLLRSGVSQWLRFYAGNWGITSSDSTADRKTLLEPWARSLKMLKKTSFVPHTVVNIKDAPNSSSFRLSAKVPKTTFRLIFFFVPVCNHVASWTGRAFSKFKLLFFSLLCFQLRMN